MARTIGELEGDVLEILQKTPGFQGFYTENKVVRALQDSFDYLGSHMADSVTGGWLDNIRYIDTVPGQAVVEIPNDILMIKAVRYLISNIYVELYYDRAVESTQYAPNSGQTQIPSRYRIVDNKLYFNPPMGFGGSQYLQIEYAGLPPVLVGNEQQIIGFNRALCHYVKYRTCSILASAVGKFNKEWQMYEDQWFERAIVLLNKRVNSTNYVRNFEG